MIHWKFYGPVSPSHPAELFQLNLTRASIGCARVTHSSRACNAQSNVHSMRVRGKIDLAWSCHDSIYLLNDYIHKQRLLHICVHSTSFRFEIFQSPKMNDSAGPVHEQCSKYFHWTVLNTSNCCAAQMTIAMVGFIHIISIGVRCAYSA